MLGDTGNEVQETWPPTESGLLLSLSVSTYWQSKTVMMAWTTLG